MQRKVQRTPNQLTEFSKLVWSSLYILWGERYHLTWKMENFGYFSVKLSYFCGFVRKGKYFFLDRIICQFTFNQKYIHLFHTQRGGGRDPDKKCEISHFFDWELSIAQSPTWKVQINITLDVLGAASMPLCPLKGKAIKNVSSDKQVRIFRAV